MSLALVGDIGGTNARFALWDGQQLQAAGVLATRDHASPLAAVRAYLAGQHWEGPPPDRVCLACAGPVQGELFRFTNNAWQLERGAFIQALGLHQLLLVNDFAAMALGTTRLAPGDWLEVRPGEAVAGQPRLVIGPGTGLGVAALLPGAGGRWNVLPGEGGHVFLPVGSGREASLWQILARQQPALEAESVLSGPGLPRLYRAVCQLEGLAAPLQSAAEISAAAALGDQAAWATLEQFCQWLGRVVSNAALTFGARGGIDLAGGLLPHFSGFFLGSGFCQALLDKGWIRDYLARIPVRLVTAPWTGLQGAALALEQEGRP